MTYLEQQLERTDGLLPNWAFEDGSTADAFRFGVKQDIIQSHINYLQSEIERLDIDYKVPPPPKELVSGITERNISVARADEVIKYAGRFNYNKAIQDQISHLKKQIINANKLLK